MIPVQAYSRPFAFPSCMPSADQPPFGKILTKLSKALSVITSFGFESSTQLTIDWYTSVGIPFLKASASPRELRGDIPPTRSTQDDRVIGSGGYRVKVLELISKGAMLHQRAHRLFRWDFSLRSIQSREDFRSSRCSRELHSLSYVSALHHRSYHTSHWSDQTLELRYEGLTIGVGGKDDLVRQDTPP